MRWNTPQNWMGCKEHCDWLPGIPPMTLGVNRRSFSGKMCLDAGKYGRRDLPCLIYSHGAKGTVEDSYMLMERYASWFYQMAWII